MGLDEGNDLFMKSKGVCCGGYYSELDPNYPPIQVSACLGNVTELLRCSKFIKEWLFHEQCQQLYQHFVPKVVAVELVVNKRP